MKGRSKLFEECDVVEKAIEVFWTKGYEAASTEELLAAMGIGKGSFYHSFQGGKKELFEKALKQFSKDAISKFKLKLESCETPIEEIRAFFKSVALDKKGSHLKGCFLGNTIAELAAVESELTLRASSMLKDLETLFYEVLVSERKKGNLKTKENLRVVAASLITFWNGISITRRMYPDKKVLEPIIELNLKILF